MEPKVLLIFCIDHDLGHLMGELW